MIGQQLVLGFEGTAITKTLADLIRKYKVGNVILFRDNIASKEQLRKLCMDIQDLILDATGQPAFITIDQEGGMVSRLSDDMVNVPGNMAIAATGKAENAYRMARIAARQLRSVGVNFNLAPVVDVNSNSKNPVIGVRSYGDDPQQVAKFAVEAVRGFQDEGFLCCAKHFPGHGDTNKDSHIALPVVEKSLPELRECELIPYLAVFEQGIPAVMSSHIVFPKIEPSGVPATMSRRIMNDLLRNEMGFHGLVLSDAMEMDAIRKHWGIAPGMIEAWKAGVDLILQCGYCETQEETILRVLDAVESGEIPLEEIEASYERILNAKSKYAFAEPQPDPTSRDEYYSAVAETACDTVTIYEGKAQTLHPDTFFCGMVDYRLTNVENDEDYYMDFVTYMLERFPGSGMLFSVDPSEEEIASIVSEARQHSNIVLGTCNGHLFRGQLALAKALAETGLPMTVIALRDPYDLAEIPSGICKAAVYDYTRSGLTAAEAFLRTGRAPGQMPVKL